jgi:hypothetical protein
LETLSKSLFCGETAGTALALSFYRYGNAWGGIMNGRSIFSALFLLLCTFSLESKATTFQCQEPYYSRCNAGCGGASCRRSCRTNYCGNIGGPTGQINSFGANAFAQSPAYVPPSYGIPQYYGPFFPGYDNVYLNSLTEDLNRQRNEILQLRAIAQQLGDPVLTAVTDAALAEVQGQLNQVQYLQYPQYLGFPLYSSF